MWIQARIHYGPNPFSDSKHFPRKFLGVSTISRAFQQTHKFVIDYIQKILFSSSSFFKFCLAFKLLTLYILLEIKQANNVRDSMNFNLNKVSHPMAMNLKKRRLNNFQILPFSFHDWASKIQLFFGCIVEATRILDFFYFLCYCR